MENLTTSNNTETALNMNEFGVLILSDRDRKEFDYILEVRGADWVHHAVKNLIGNRKPYVSNLAKIMKLDIPQDLPDKTKVIPIEEGLAKLPEYLKKRLKNKEKNA